MAKVGRKIFEVKHRCTRSAIETSWSRKHRDGKGTYLICTHCRTKVRKEK